MRLVQGLEELGYFGSDAWVVGSLPDNRLSHSSQLILYSIIWRLKASQAKLHPEVIHCAKPIAISGL